MMLRLIVTAAVIAALSACGNAEKAGENADSAIETATQGHENPGDGPLERAGEAADHATGSERQGDAADAVNDATDGDSRTKP